ncbi:protein translocase subunit SecD [Amorphus orientalis]|uniref:Protein translocase subunit SecD n=1 Tax=Amorphus orientalis TaxID=649198 RepID=A0AAE4AT02_9HYPH|nr:protein translocase subunit SecD [Amorphus orientalis]MDQ0315823.1 preprotein translocase subunit SecD/SecD/SecF fusion protein [Amorphus orientalis]
MLYFARWKIALIIGVAVIGLLAVIPNFFPKSTVDSWPSWLPHRQIVLGLDLQGGAYLLYQVDREDYVQKRLQSLVGEIRQELREEPRIGYTGLGVANNGAQVRIRDTAQVEAAQERLADLVNPLQSTLFGQGAVDEFQMTTGEGGLIRFTFTEDGLSQRIRSIVQQSIEVIRRRIDELGTTEPNIQRQGEDRILVEAPGLDDPERLKALVGQTAQLTFHLVDTTVDPRQAIETRPPPGNTVLYSMDDPPQPYVVEESALLGGEDLVDAQATFNQQTNEPIVTFRLSTGGARKFGNVTTNNVGRPFAIVLDEEVISAPVIREPIIGGSGQISGNFTVQTANDLAILLRAGALPARLTIVEERTVGPGLGQDSIEAGEIAAVVAVIGVAVAMLAVYGLFGVFANIALAVNVILILGLLSLLQATLTLPGIAGIVLTMGMAVDANVLIYERIREEARQGRSAITAIDAGFSRALGTILDANITTLIAAVILFQLGSGPVRGFAVTLAIGIVTTVFSAFMFTRLLVAQWVRMRRPSAVPL